MLKPNIENFIGCDCDYERSRMVLYGAPFDSTTSFRPGARFGPSAMRHESFGLETYSPYQDADLTERAVFDSGDLELCFGSAQTALEAIEARAAEILQDGKFPLLLGGEHLVTLGAVRAAVKRYPELHIIHFDAHADLRDDYLGAKLSTPAFCVDAMSWQAMDASISSAFAAATGRSSGLLRRIRTCTPSGLRAWRKRSRPCGNRGSPFTSPLTWTAWIPPRFPEQVRRRRGRQLSPTAGGHPDDLHHPCGGCRHQRTGPHAGPQRRFHRHRLQSAAGTDISAA